MWEELAPWLAQGGVTAALAWAMLTLVRIAINAERGRADDWRRAAQASAETAAVTKEQVGRLVAAVETLTVAQRESLATLQKLSADHGSAA